MIAIKKTVRWVLYVLAFLLSLIVIAALVIRFVVFPNIHQYKDDIATFASQKMGQKVLIGDIVTGWDDISPHVELLNVDVFDAENRVALHLNNVEASLSWLSVPMLQPKLTELLIHNPALTIRRNADGGIFLAGINLAGESKPAFANWLLKQRNVIVENAQIIWQDDLRQAPELSLKQFNLTLTRPLLNSLLGQHDFEISSFLSTGSAQKISVNGHFIGNDVSQAKTWHGEIMAALKQTELAAFKPWLDYPINIQNGLGNAKINLTFGNAQILSLKGNVAISNLALVTKNETTPLVATKFAGDLLWSRLNNTQTIIAQHIQLNTNTGLNIQDGSATYVSSIKNNQPWIKANVRLNQLNLATLKQIASHIHLPKNILAQLNGFAPVGLLQAVNFNWEGTANKPESYLVNAQFKQLGIQAFQKIPGFSNLTGTLKADEDGGEVTLASQNTTLDFKDILRWPIPASQLKGDINWKIRQGKTIINAKDIFISSPHITGTVNASYDMNGIKGGHMNLTGKFDKGNAKYAPFYYPIILGENTIHWLDTSILGGRADNVLLTVKGNLADFPFVNRQNKPDNKLGIFKVTAKISDATLHYGDGWPSIDSLNLDMLFEGKRMLLESNSGRISGKKILKSRAEIAQLDADWPILHIVSEAEGLVSDGIKFVNESPVQQVTLGFTDNLKTAGRGNLQLTLDIPLEDAEQSKYKGIYKVTNGTIFANAALGLPELTKLNGSLIFNEKGIFANNISTEVLGGPAQFSLNTGADKAIKVVANGRINDAGIKNLMPNVFTNQLSGNANWAGEIAIKKPLVDFNFRSNLVGLAIDLPPPFTKLASQEILLNIDKKQNVVDKDAININYGQLVSAKILRSLKADQLVFESGDIGINTAAVNPLQAGLSIRGKLDELDADEWLALLSEQSSTQSSANTPANNQLDLNILAKADLNVQKLTLFDRSINALKVVAVPSRSGLKMVVDAQEMSGNVEWQDADNGKIIARLKRLTIPSTLTAVIKSNDRKEFRKLAQTYPALDIVADNFELGTKNSGVLKLGSLALNAFENGEDWVIQKLNINNVDSTLAIHGNWHNWTRNPNTSLIVSLNTNNIGKTFSRFGQADTIRGGEAKMNGQINWAGSPHEFDVTRLDGNLNFEATKGQILKVKPGVGRLFGLVTLQSLPRRLSLDFRDLFSDGFAFDKISATARINSGVVRSDDFFMTGPAAEASIKGETDLKAETQHLNVKVVPHISDSLSLAALAGGPIVGAAAFVAQKILKDPFNKIASSEYVIKGTWDNPIEASKDAVEKPDTKSPLN